jgi:hypothetical protein
MRRNRERFRFIAAEPRRKKAKLRRKKAALLDGIFLKDGHFVFLLLDDLILIK